MKLDFKQMAIVLMDDLREEKLGLLFYDLEFEHDHDSCNS